MARWARLWRWGKRALQLGLATFFVWLVWREVHAINVHQVRSVLAKADLCLLAAGIAVAFLAVGVMGLYDALAYPGGVAGTLSFAKRWLLGAVFFGWTDFISMGPFGGPALRIIAYRNFGLSAAEISRGLVGLYIAMPAGNIAWLAAAWLPTPAGSVAIAARLVLAMAFSVGLAMAVGKVAVAIGRHHRYGSELEGIPFARLGLVSFAEWGLILVAFYLLTRSVGITVDGLGAARTVFTGEFAGIVSMMPGGLGSADAVWFKSFHLLGVPYTLAAAGVLVFRVGFYLAPWLVALVVLYTVLLKRSVHLQRWQRRLVAAAILLNALLLLVSSATPAISGRLRVLAKLVPLGAIELSHMLATVSAAMMIFLVRGLSRGYRGAYIFTMALLAASALAHPLKGGDYEESMISIAMMLLLFGVRGAFTRRGRVPIGWELTLAAAVGSLTVFLVVGLTGFGKIPYHHDLWTDFGEWAQASRYLRSALLLGLIALVLILRQAMRPATRWVTPSEDDIARAEEFARAHASSAEALLVGGGDKAVWFWERENGETAGMLLYQLRGDRLVCFRDGVLADGAVPSAMIQAFRTYTDSLDVDVVFTMISGRWMEYLHDFGFHFLKVGEEALVSLADFSLAGHRNAGFRRLLREMEKAGVVYETLQPPFDQKTMDELRATSDAWLASKGGHELQFSACYFSPSYIQRNPVAVARDATGSIIAFTNTLVVRAGGPATVDFMRYRPGTVDNVMDFVLIRTMQTLAEDGYRSLSLGGAPLSDVGVWRSSRFAERFLHMFSTRAERIYNYRGLLEYKNKFHPEWRPRYIAYQHPWEWASALVTNSRLVMARSRADRRRIALARAGQSR